MTVDFKKYDFVHLGVSSGKDSTAAFLWTVFESDIPKDKLIVTFCDTGNEDLLTYAYIKALSHYHPIVTIKPDLDFWELAIKKSRFPSSKARFCTQHLKVIPTMRYILELMKAGEILLLSGVTKREGTAQNNRGNLEQFGTNETFGLDQFLPIYFNTLDDIWMMHKKHLPSDFSINLVKDDPKLSEENKQDLISKLEGHGIPRNPIYDMQAKRVGCFPCIHSRKLEIRGMAKYRPERIDFIEQKEIELGEIRKERGSNTHYSSLFARNTVPERFRSKEIITKDGGAVMVATIRDVVEWSMTAYGGKQYQMEFAAFEDVTTVCDVRGMCE